MTVLSSFNFNNTLFNSNNKTLAMPKGPTGSRPYAAVAAERQSGGQPAAFTSEKFAFDKFNLSKPLPKNVSLEANVSTFTVDWNCHQLNLSTTPPVQFSEEWQINASTTNNPGTACSKNISQEIRLAGTDTDARAWINVTRCKDDEVGLLATLWVPTRKDIWDLPKAGKSLGFFCNPRYSIGDASVKLNASSGMITSYTINYESFVDVNIQTSMEATYAYLTNPNDSRFQTSTTGPLEQLELNQTVVRAAAHSFIYLTGIDPFFASMTGRRLGNLSETYMENPEVFKSEVETFASQIMVQVVSSFARVEDSTETRGLLTTIQPRIFIRQFTLRLL
ncbi:uncharacterized protein K452DRAFT_307300 [Aplosporella prunicola CBS 121167]|uniref:Uncharacterized protein n=1 Tax=Aplosporella prunicola CBS 121167 TaxID=1176127 RepID=A0A6A6BG30_9PEZI|nr:uncharacterized protein K452DRAFT_307300 [Aplosporella prunicola CBS 121167]KAF2143120.1 hypothetical protein K452DRAFT_307300 [Aplosporella prunicola CBS 121167]